MSGALKFIGWCVIVLGVLAGVVLVSTAKWELYSFVKQSYQNLPGNELAQQRYNLVEVQLIGQVAAGIGAALSGIVTGIVFFAMSHGLDLLIEIRNAGRAERPKPAASSQ